MLSSLGPGQIVRESVSTQCPIRLLFLLIGRVPPVKIKRLQREKLSVASPVKQSIDTNKEYTYCPCKCTFTRMCCQPPNH